MAEANLALEKLPPQNLEAEQAVLGGILLDNSVLPQVVEILQPRDFYRAGHRRIFESMLALFERDDTIDLITVREQLEQKNHLEESGGFEMSLDRGAHWIVHQPESKPVEQHARQTEASSTGM